MSSTDQIDKFVDSHFLPHFKFHNNLHHPNAPPHLKNSSCSLCNKMTNADFTQQSIHREIMINQDDIDLLQLMNPKMTPQLYMKNILKFYKKQQNLRSRQDKNQPMQQALSTKRIFNTLKDCHDDSQRLPAQLQIDHEEQERQQHSDKQQINRLRDACYIGLGKAIVERQEKQSHVELNKSNYHTRQYLLPHVRGEVAKLEQSNQIRGEQKYYLITSANSRGISFEVDKMPDKLGRILQFSKFRQIVCTINQIIQRHVYAHKMEMSRNKKISSMYIWLWTVLIIIISLMLLNSQKIQSQILEMVCLVASLCLMIFILMMSCHRFNQDLKYVSLIDLLDNRITEYLNYLNSRPGASLCWKTANNLFWIEITPLQIT